ncbi:MAG TPA: hypothetical protein VG722_02445 [Tepidisphaeraceae bacterium]|nr:hypothetical protein [Tepidisphaeraceae bacterium]
MSQVALIDGAPPRAAGALFTLTELRRVGVAATMIVICGTIIIVAITVALGHYSTLSHCGPKAVLDGAVVAMLLGRSGRWRCLALLGTVYGFVLLLQIGVFYLLPVMMLAGIVASAAGWLVSWANRLAALVTAAAVYELLCGFGAPVQIYFGTGGGHEPIIWGLWFAEWPLRFFGAALGVWLMARWLKTRQPFMKSPRAKATSPLPLQTKSSAQTRTTAGAAVRLVLCIIACTVPMGIDSTKILAGIALLYLIYAWCVDMRRGIVHALAGLCWGWLAFGAMSYLWHHDLDRVVDLGRTLVLRFAPLTLASMVLASTVRPVDLFRLLRRLRISSAVLMPLATVARNLPRSRRIARQSIAELKERGWLKPSAILRRPIAVSRILLGSQLAVWADQLLETPTNHDMNG